MTNYLTEPLPVALTIDGVEHPISTDFRAVLRYDALIREGREDGSELEEALQIIFGEIPDNGAGAIEQLNWFVRGGEPERKHKPSNRMLGINSEKPMDYAEDSRLIWSAFRRVYGINLRDVEYLHWWDFLAMLEELPDDVRLSRVIELRTKDVTNKHLSKEERTRYRALQHYYRIQDKPSKRQELLNEALRRGEDPTPYL